MDCIENPTEYFGVDGLIGVAVLDMIHTCGMMAVSVLWGIDVYNRYHWSDIFSRAESEDFFVVYCWIPALVIIFVLAFVIVMTLQILDPIALLLLRKDGGGGDHLCMIRTYARVYYMAQGFTFLIFGVCVIENVMDVLRGWEIEYRWDFLALWLFVRGLIFQFGYTWVKSVVTMVKYNFRRSGREYYRENERESRM